MKSTQHFTVLIDKKEQTAKRNHLLKKTYRSLGISVVNHERGAMVIKAEKNFSVGDIITGIDESVVRSAKSFEHLLNTSRGPTVKVDYLSILSSYKMVHTKTITPDEKQLAIVANEAQMDMTRNLQYGVITAIGGKAAAHFPEAHIGDILLLHHIVEYKPRTEGDLTYNDVHLMGIEEETGNEYRWADAEKQVFGVLKMDGTIIPHPDYVFCHGQLLKSDFQFKNGIWVPDAWQKKAEDFTRELEEIQSYVTQLQASSSFSKRTTDANYKRKEEIKQMIDSLNKERRKLSKEMNQKRLMEATVLFFNPKSVTDTGEVLHQGDKIICDHSILYPLDIGGTRFEIARSKFIDLKITEARKPIALGDRVIVRPEAKKKAAGMIIVPDTVEQKSESGSVVSVGSTFKEDLCIGDRIIHSKSSTEVVIDNEPYSLMKIDDIYGKILN